MALYAHHLVQERDEIMANNVRLVQLGRRDQLPAEVLAKFDETSQNVRRQHRADGRARAQLRRAG